MRKRVEVYVFHIKKSTKSEQLGDGWSRLKFRSIVVRLTITTRIKFLVFGTPSLGCWKDSSVDIL